MDFLERRDTDLSGAACTTSPLVVVRGLRILTVKEITMEGSGCVSDRSSTEAGETSRKVLEGRAPRRGVDSDSSRRGVSRTAYIYFSGLGKSVCLGSVGVCRSHWHSTSDDTSTHGKRARAC